MSISSIEWTDVTWNPVRGCTRVSEACRHCYAERFAARGLPAHRSPTTGKPFAVMREGGPRWTGHVELIPEKLDEPLRWRKPRRVFVNSMSDLLHEHLTEYDIAEVWARMAAAERHTFQVLTKRAQRLPELLSDPDFRNEVDRRMFVLDPPPGPSIPGYTQAWPLPNVWLGVSVEDQKTADERIPLLLQTPAAVRFVSYEPALAPVDFAPYLFRNRDPRFRVCPRCLYATNVAGETDCPNDGATLQHEDIALDWLIVGGESGPHARPFDVAWARSVVRQCREAGTACFVKQFGSHIVASGDAINGWPIDEVQGLWSDCRYDPPRVHVKDSKGGDPAEWPADLRVREFPSVGGEGRA